MPEHDSNTKKHIKNLNEKLRFIFLYCSLLAFLAYHTLYSVFSILTGKRLKRIDIE